MWFGDFLWVWQAQAWLSCSDRAGSFCLLSKSVSNQRLEGARCKQPSNVGSRAKPAKKKKKPEAIYLRKAFSTVSYPLAGERVKLDIAVQNQNHVRTYTQAWSCKSLQKLQGVLWDFYVSKIHHYGWTQNPLEVNSTNVGRALARWLFGRRKKSEEERHGKKKQKQDLGSQKDLLVLSFVLWSPPLAS